MSPAITASLRDRWLVMRLVTRVLLLAGRTIIARTLSLIQMPYFCTADPAGFCVALVDEELLAKITCVAVGADIVAQRRAADADRRTQHGAHGAYQAGGFRTCEAFCLSLRTD